MAGGKETPRQKMIGMMYLVLTALLALQVSNAVLEKFAIIVGTLDQVTVDSDVKNELVLRSINQEAGASQSENVIKAKENATKVRELTKQTVKSIDELKVKMMSLSGTDHVNEGLINDHSMKVATMMIAPGSPEGKAFEKLLADYVSQINTLANLKLESLAKSPKEMPMFANDKDHKEKDFLTFNFENTPVIAALATVTQMQTEILEYENKALTELSKLANARVVKFDQIVPMVRPEASVVAAGAKYKAEMFITASSSAVVPEFYKDGTKLEVITDATGVKMGKVEFTAQGGGYDKNGLARKTFKSLIELNGEKYEKEIEYFVAAPVIKVTTGNAPTLYMECGNNVNIEVPALGTNYNPSFTANGAQLQKGDKPGKVTIIPQQRKVTIGVSNGGVNIGSQAFDVKPVPKPHFEIKESSGKEVDMRNGIRGSSLTTLRVNAVPEENFKNEVPKDAVYRIRTMEVIHARGTAPINRMTATNESIELAGWRSQFRPGDNIVIEVKTVTRRTFLGKDDKVDIGTQIFRVPIQ